MWSCLSIVRIIIIRIPDDKNIAEIIIAKQRNGPIGTGHGWHGSRSIHDLEMKPEEIGVRSKKKPGNLLALENVL